MAAGRSAWTLELEDVGTHLLAIRIDLVHIYSVEIHIYTILGPGDVAH
jgi:hypothetical protein